MNTDKPNLAELLIEVRRQLAFSQEDLARGLGVSYVTVNRWENGHSIPSRLATARFNGFCEEMIERGKLVLPEGDRA